MVEGAISSNYLKKDFEHRLDRVSTNRVVDLWNSSTEEVVSSSSLAISKNELYYLMTAIEIW